MARVRKSKTNTTYFMDIIPLERKSQKKKIASSPSTTQTVEVMPTQQELTKSVMTLLKEKMSLKAEHKVLWEQSSEIRKKLYHLTQQISEKDDIIEDTMLSWDAVQMEQA